MCKTGAIAGVLLTGFLLAGCGASEQVDSVDRSGTAAVIQVLKDGSIVETIKEDFTADYYNEDELRNMILVEAAEFNRDSQADISVDKIESSDGVITAVFQYPSAEVYTEYNTNQYNNSKLFFGTVAEAYDAGYSMDISLRDAKKPEEGIGKEELLGMGEYHILILQEPAMIQTYGKILYVSDNVIPSGKNQADMSTGEEGESLGTYYVILK